MSRPGRTSCALLACLALGMSALHATQPEPFAIPRAQLLAAIKTIALMPVAIDDSVPDADALASVLEQEITRRLQQCGFTVVPPSVMREIRARAQTAIGGVYDPMTGAPLAERLAALEEFSEQEYRTQHPADAILRAAVVPRQVTFTRGVAVWDGVSEQVGSSQASAGMQRALSFLALGKGTLAEAHVVALSLEVTVADPRGNTLYSRAGGLLTLEYPTTYLGQVTRYELATAGPRSLSGNSSLTSRALDVALNPLAGSAVATQDVPFLLPPSEPRGKHASAGLKDFPRTHRRIALADLEMPVGELPQRERVLAHYRELLTARLTTLGFEVTGRDDLGKLWAAERAAAGGFYDPATGHANLAKINAARARVTAALKERDGVSALAWPEIIARKAACGEGYARWDGVTQPVSGGGSLLFNKSIFNTSLNYSGELDARSLRLQISDETGQVLFEGLGGIELTQLAPAGLVAELTDAELFANPGTDVRAVEESLRALASVSGAH
jgi:hypothetical protein